MEVLQNLRTSSSDLKARKLSLQSLEMPARRRDGLVVLTPRDRRYALRGGAVVPEGPLLVELLELA